MTLITLSRDELYSLVWQRPLRELGKDYGVSDVWVAKVCRRMEIPLPGRGYWAKVAHGKKTYLMPLKEPSQKCQRIISFDASQQSKRSLVTPQAEELLIQEITQSLAIKRLTLPFYKIISETRSQLRNAKENNSGILVVKSAPLIDVRVGRNCVERCLELLNVLLGVLEERGFSLVIDKDERTGRPKSYMQMGEDKVQFYIEEQLDATPHILTKAEEKKAARKKFLYGRYAMYPGEYHLHAWEPPAYDYHPSGRLLLKIDNITSSGLRQKWQDKDGRTLEDFLPRIIVGFIDATNYLAGQRIERERWQQAWAREEQEREEIVRKEQLEKERIQHLDVVLRKWSQRKEILEIIAHIESEMVAEEKKTMSFTEWLNWLIGYADQLQTSMEAGILNERPMA